MKKTLMAFLILCVSFFVSGCIDSDIEMTNSNTTYSKGENVKVGYISYQVYKVYSQKRIGSYDFGKTANANYLIVDVSAKNEDTQSRMIPDFELVDENGSSYESDSESAMYLPDNKAFYFDSLNPGVQKRGYVVFDVPEGKQYKLKISGGYFSSGYAYINLM